jgi:hypothetical protein
MTNDAGQNLATLSLSSSFGYDRWGQRRESELHRLHPGRV